jgi:hypothetical protein
MSTPRADVVDTGHKYRRAGSIIINAPAADIFNVIADPAMHAKFDGSGTVEGQVNGPSRLALGDHFGMAMRIKLPYRMDNEVVEFEDNRVIAWRHVGHHRWRYELEEIEPGITKVTETFDGSTARLPVALNLINAYENNQKAILKSLVRLKQLVETS